MSKNILAHAVLILFIGLCALAIQIQLTAHIPAPAPLKEELYHDKQKR